MGAGLALGAVAVLGYAFDIVPELPPEVLKLVLYKLVGIGAFGLIVFGALLGRLSRRITEGPEASAARERALPREGLDIPQPPMTERASQDRH